MTAYGLAPDRLQSRATLHIGSDLIRGLYYRGGRDFYASSNWTSGWNGHVQSHMMASRSISRSIERAIKLRADTKDCDTASLSQFSAIIMESTHR